MAGLDDACSTASTVKGRWKPRKVGVAVLMDNMDLSPAAGAPAVQRGPRNPPSSNRMQGNSGGGRGGPFRGGGVPTEGFKNKIGVAVLCGNYLADDVVSRFPMDEGTFPCAFPCNSTVCRKDHIYPERYGVREGKGREADALVSVPLKALGALALDENDPNHAQVCVPMRQLLCCCCPYRCLPNAPFPHLSHAGLLRRCIAMHVDSSLPRRCQSSSRIWTGRPVLFEQSTACSGRLCTHFSEARQNS